MIGHNLTNKLEEEGANNMEFWMECGQNKETGVYFANLYLGKGRLGFNKNANLFDEDKPILEVTPKDARLQTPESLANIVMRTSQWVELNPTKIDPSKRNDPEYQEVIAFSEKRKENLIKITKYMLKAMRNPEEWLGMTKDFHIDASDPLSVDVAINANTGKEEQHDDIESPTYRTALSRREQLRNKANKTIENLHSFLELNGVYPNQDPNAPANTALPIQKKNSDILGSMEISSTPEETQDAETAISDDTSNKAVALFERFDIISRSNLKGLRDFEDVVKREGGDGFVFVSQIESERPEILSYKEIIILLKKVMEEQNMKSKLIDDENIETLTDMANYLFSEGYKSLTICTTSDKIGEYKNEIARKNNMPTEAGTFSFEPLEVQKIDALGDEDMKDINNAVLDNNFSIFLKHIGTGDITLAKKIYLKMRRKAVV